MKKCSHFSHDEWFPNTPRRQHKSEFYKGQGFTCKKCSRTSASILSKKKRQQRRDGIIALSVRNRCGILTAYSPSPRRVTRSRISQVRYNKGNSDDAFEALEALAEISSDEYMKTKKMK